MRKTTPQFDFEEALEALKSGRDLNGKDGILTPLIKQLTEAALAAELEQHIKSTNEQNRKNGATPKTVKSASGSFQLDTPRDRNGTFEPQLIKKHQTHLTDEIERKILSLFALGSSYQDISGHISEIYGIDVSSATISAVTDKLIPELREWQQRPLDSHYPFVWLDAIHHKVKDDGRYVSKAVYTVLGLNIEGKKEVLGLYVSESEGARFWLYVLTDLNNRGVQDILIAAVDGLTGFPEAINSIFLKPRFSCASFIRSAINEICGVKKSKAFMADLKPVYKAPAIDAAEDALDALEAKWGKQYPIVIQSWRNKWENLSVYFKYPEPIRRVIYTTNTIEAVHRQFRKLTKTKGGFPNENSLLKLLYVGIKNASKKWTMPIQNWNLTLSQLAIYFEGRLDAALDL